MKVQARGGLLDLGQLPPPQVAGCITALDVQAGQWAAATRRLLVLLPGPAPSAAAAVRAHQAGSLPWMPLPSAWLCLPMASTAGLMGNCLWLQARLAAGHALSASAAAPSLPPL